MTKRSFVGQLAWQAGLLLCAAHTTMAGPIGIGNFTGATVEFVDVDGNNDALFDGATVSGDTLQLELRFLSVATGGGTNTTPGVVTLDLLAQPGFVLSQINVFEGGVYSLLGPEVGATTVLSEAMMDLSITAVDGAAITPVGLSTNASSLFNLVSNPGTDNPWSLGLGNQLNNILTINGVPFSFGATAVSITLSNTLSTTSASGTTAEIGKEFWDISATSTPISAVPEPGTLALCVTGLCTFVAHRYRRRALDCPVARAVGLSP